MGCARIKSPSRISIRELFRKPPSACLFRVLRIFQVNDTKDQTFKAPRVAGKICISSAIIHKTMNAHRKRNAIIPITQELRIYRIFLNTVNTDSIHCFMFFRIDRRPLHKCRTAAGAMCYDQKIICNLDLRVVRCRIGFFIDRCKMSEQFRFRRI